MSKPRRIYTPEEIAMIKRYAGLGATLNQISYLVDEETRTLTNQMEYNPEVREAIENGRAKAAIRVMETAYDMATNGDYPAMTTFWLKTRCNWREAKEPLPDDADKVDKIKKLPTSELIKLVKEKIG